MKLRPFLAFLSLACPLTLPAAEMVSSNDRVNIDVKIDASSDHKDLPKTNTDTVTQHRTLDIALTGKARSNEARVVKWTVFGKNLKNNNIRVLGSGEIKLAFDAQGSAKVQSKEVTCTYTPEHSVVENNRGRGLNNRNGNNNTLPRAKRVEAEGEKYLGYSVQVLDGARVVGEASDPIGIKIDTK